MPDFALLFAMALDWFIKGLVVAVVALCVLVLLAVWPRKGG